MLGMLVQAAHYTIQDFLSSSKEGGIGNFAGGGGVFFTAHNSFDHWNQSFP